MYQYAHLLLSEMLNCMCDARILMKLELHGAYKLLLMKERDEYKMACRMHCNQFKCRVMPFGLTNTTATFQSYIDDCLLRYIDDFAVCYLKDILIRSANMKEHEEQVRQVLHWLKESDLCCNGQKWQFKVLEVGFL